MAFADEAPACSPPHPPPAGQALSVALTPCPRPPPPATARASLPKAPERSERLRLLNLKYDLMPAEYVTMIISEFGMVPATSVPAILREFAKSDEKMIAPAQY